MKKRLTLFSLLLLFTMTAMAQTLVDGIYYHLNGSENTAEVTQKNDGTKYSGDIVIPASISVDGVDYSVTSIGFVAFRGCSNLTSIEIPTSVTEIGDYAFSECSGLTSLVVEEGNSYYDSRDNCNAIIETASNTLIVGCQNTIIPSSVTSIGYGAFWNCSGLSNIEIPNSVKEIGDYAFYLCSGLKDIEIPNSVTSIGDWAFNACRNLTHISIPNSVTEIGDDAFVLCSSLTSIEIPNSVTFLGKAVFARCSSLTMIVVEEGNSNYDSRDNCNAIIETASNTLIAGCRNTVIPYSVTSIGEYAFNECTGLSSIEIPNTVTEIGNCAFEGCYHLTHIGIPNSVAEIGESVFAYCHGLKSIEIPNSVMSIGTKAFAQCSGLTSVIMQSTTPPTVGISLFDECGKLETIYVPTGAVEAYNVAPWNAYNIVELVEIINPMLVDGLYYNVDVENKTAEVVAGPNDTKYSGDIAIPASISINGIKFAVTSIEQSAFSVCSGLTSIKIPTSVTSIGDEAFYRCSGLTSIVVEEGNSYYDSRENCNAIIETASNTLVVGCQNTIIPTSVTSIGSEAFWHCSYLTSIEIPTSVTSIGERAFAFCSGLTSIEIPNSVTSIGERAFSYCSYLTSIEIPNSVTEIGESAFRGCPGLMSIEIPNSVTEIGESAFAYCFGLTSIVVEEGNSYYDSRENCNAIIETSSNTLVAGCQNTVIPNSVTSIGESAFSGCYRLTSIEIPNSVTEIGESAFYSCSGLTSIEIPNSVTEIGESAFQYCGNLTSITMQRTTPPTVGANSFSECSKLDSIYVPIGAAEAYNVAPWNAYNIVEQVEIINPMLVDGLYYNVDVENKTAEVVDAPNDTKYSGDIVVPVSISINGIEFSVTSIGTQAFYYCSGLTSIEIPNSVTEIGDYAFEGCSGLTSIEIPNSVTSIERSAFAYCTSLDSIYIPSQVSEIGIWVFAHCDSLSTIIVAPDNSIFDSRDNCNGIIETNTNTFILGCKTSKIPDSITGIADYAFDDCSLLTTLTIPSSVSYIGSYAFYNCDGLTSIEIPTSVTSIGERAFAYCSNLTSITMQRTTPPTVGENLFNECSKLETIYVPAGAAEAYNVAPWNAYNIVEQVEIINPMLVDGLYYNVDVENKTAEVVAAPNDTKYSGDIVVPASISINGIEFSVTEIGDEAFYFCDGLTSIEIPTSVTSIGRSAFSGCSSLTSIVVEEGNSYYDSRENCNALIETASNKLIVGCQNTVIPNSVTLIGYYAFLGCSGLTSIEIPNSVTSIGRSAFFGCDGLTSIEIPNSVTEIGDNAFRDCSSLTSIEIPNSVTSIGGSAFLGCDGLTSIKIPTSVTEIGSSAFSHCSGLTSIVVEEGNSYYDSRENCNAIIETASNKLVAGCQNTVIPTSVTSIGDDAFRGCSSLTSIEIPNSVTSIGERAFNNCSGLTSIEIPTSVTEIGERAFAYSSNLTSITMQGATPPTTVGENLFYECSKLETIYVPVGSSEAYNVAPWNAYNIVELVEIINPMLVDGIYYNVDVENKTAEVVAAPNDTKYSGDIVVPASISINGIKFAVTSIGYGAFSSCTGLTSIEIPNSVTSIGGNAFSNCSGLTSIEIPNSVTWIGGNAFWNCSGLTSITMQTATPPETSSDISGGFSSLSIIYVPAGAFEAYNVAPWNKYLIIDNRELYEELQAKCEALKDLNCFLPEAAPIGFSDHGLLVSESQLSTNKQEKIEGPIADLLDGDVDTFFHSTWSETNSDGAFAYIETDLGTMVDNLVIRYARRTKLGQRNDAPTSIRLLGEEPSAPGEWTDLGVYTLSCDKICFDRLDFGASLTISLPKKYQHLRFQVEETVDGAITNGNQFFNISEFGVWDCAPYLDVISHFSAEQVAEVEAVSMAAAEELNNGRVTQATIDRLDAILALMNGFVELTDGMAYTQAEAMEAYRITYTREFKNTQWQSWYVPFDMDYNDVSDEYTVACLNDIHEYDDDEDGILDRWTMEVLMLRPGETIYANLPYVIRAKAVGEKQFVVDNTTLYPADEQSMDCSSMRMLYTFRGVYSPLEAQVLRDNGWLAMGGGRLVTPTVNSTLKANRWYMESTPRGGYATQYEAPKRIELVVVDENGEVTGIEELPLTEDKNAVWPADVYDLNGRLVKAQAKNLNELPKGVYIVRGEKIVK